MDISKNTGESKATPNWNWVRLWNDMPTDPKWRVVAKRSGRPLAEVLSVFVMMLTNAGANATERGTLCNWCDEDIAVALDMEPDHVAAIRQAMQGKTLDGDRLSGWEKRQPKREDGGAERAKAWRERTRTQPNATERTRTLREEERREEEEDNTPLPPKGGPTPGDALKAFEAYNATALRCGLQQAARLTPDRQRKLIARLRDYGLDGWTRALANVERSSFLTGKNDRGWRATLDFLLQAQSFGKVHDGGYGNGRHAGSATVVPFAPKDPNRFEDEAYLLKIAKELGVSVNG